MKNKSAKSHILSYCAGSALLALAAFSAGQAAAGVHAGEVLRTPAGDRIFIRYDSAGFPIWGYSPCGRPIYAYSPGGKPIFLISGIHSGCLVPAWNPRPHYRATPGPWTCAASTFRRRPAGMQDRFLLRGPATVPAAPGPAPSYIRPVSTGSGNVSP
ncbi:hypothetical protein [Akkermansia sp.]|uniref:hypothetical protein n=1 Tax=Akkermansia sp. TaxID=1872421 RepID=UPI0039913999